MSAVTKFRSPHKVHILSWALALEKDGSVACHFKDCQFMAFSIEEMGNHYPYCSCENSKFLFVCELCNRRTDTTEKLLLHKLYAHSCKLSCEEIRMVTDYERIPVKKEITPILKRAWEIFLETRKYIKCLSRQCLYVTESLEIMEDHYVNSCKETFWSQLKSQCEFCYGRVVNDFDLNTHVKTAHESKTYLMSNRTVPDSNLNCIEIWSNEILLNKFGRCFIEGCQFVDNNIKILEKHYASCNGKRKNCSVCSTCGSWLQNESRLNEHKRCLHKDLDGNDYGNISFDFEKNSDNQRSLLLDEMSPDESDSQYRESGMDIENDDRKSNDMKKYNGAKRVPRKYSNASLSPVFPAKNTNSHQSIDCAKVEDRSGIQYDVDIIKINEGSLDIIDIDSSNTKKVLNDGMKLTNDKKSRRRRKSISHTPAEKTLLKIVEKNSSLTDGNRESFPTPLQAFADEMMKESKNSSTVPVQIKVNNKDWTVNVSKTVVSQSKSSCEFPQNRDTLFKALKEESYKLLKLVSKKNSIRNDVRMVFDPKENRITPFHINFKMQESVPDKVMHDDGLDMSKLISSDTEDSGEEGAQPDHMVYGTKGVINITDTDVSVQINDNNFPSCSDKHISANSVTNSNEDMSEVEICEEEEFQNLNGSLLKPIGTNEDDTSYRFQNSAESMSHLAIQQSETNSENVGSKEQHHNEAILSVSCESENTIKKEIIQNVPCDDSLKNNGMSGQPGMNDQLVNLVIKQESNQNSEIGRSDIPCISNDDQLDVEGNESLKEEINQNIYVDKTSNQPLVNLSAIQTEMTTVEENDESNIILENQNKTNSMYESEYIIPEIDFVDNTSFKSSNEQINYSDSISEGGSNSSDDLASDYDNNEVLSEDEVSEVEVHDMSHNVEFITGLESNEEIVTLSSLPSSSFHCLNSGHKISDQNVEMEKDPLYVDGFTERFLFYDPETNNDDSKIHRSGCKNESDTLDNMSDEEVDFSNAKNIRNLDNFDHAVRDEQESKGENLDDFNLPNKWNWSNLRKYNSRAVKNNLVKIRNHQCAVEQNNQKQIEEEKFIGFSDLTDSSSKYSEFVTACSKLGYYDDMVILNQHYEVSQPNKRGWKLQEVGTSSSVLSSKEKKIPDGDFNSSSSVKKSYSHLPRASSVERKKDTPKISKKSVATNKNHDHKLKDDQDGLFFGFGSNDNYNKLRKNSIEISRRLSEDFSCNKNEFNDSCYFASTDYSGSETEQNDSGNMVKEGKKIKCNVTHQNSENPLSLNRNSKFKCESGTEEVEPICYETEHCNQSTKQSPSSTPVMCSSSINQNKQLYERSLMSISDIESTSEKNILIPTTESVKRKRGRPRKNHILFSTSTPTDTTSSIFNSPNTYTTQQIVNYNSEDFNKSVENILDITSFQNNSLSEKGEHSSTVADLHSFTVLAPKRRGRPRNIFVAIGSSEILTVEQSDSCPTENDQLLSKLDNENDTEMDCLTGPDSLCNSRSSDEFHLEKGNTQSNKNIFVNSSIQDHNKDEHICIETVSDNNLKVERKKIVLEQNENKKWCDVRMSPSHMDEQTTNPYNDIIASVPESGIKIKSDNFIYDINPEEASIRKEISQISNCSQLESDIYPEHAMLRPIRNEKPQIQNTEGSIAIEYDEIGKKKDRFDTLNCIDLEDGTKNAVCIADKINSPCEIDTNYFTITPVDSIQTQVDCSTASPNRKIKTHDEPGIPLKYISLGKLETDHCQNKLNKVLNSNDFGTVIKEQIEGNISSDLVACKAVDCSENIPKKKPGRPRKNSLNHFNKDRKPNIVNESSDQIPLATDNTWETGVQHAEPIQKRKPGRPRKDSLYSASNKEDSKSVVENFDEKKIDEDLNSKEITDKDEEKIVKNDDPDLWSTKTVTTIESSSSSPNQLQKVSFNLLNDKEGNSQGVIKNQGNNQCGEPKSNELSNKTHKIKKGNGISQEFFESKDVSVTSVHNKEGVKCKIGIIDCKNTKKLLKSNEFRNKNERIEGNLNTDSFLLKVEDMSKCDTDFSKEDVDRKSGCPKRDEFDPVCIKDKGENKLVAEIFSPISTSQYEKKHSCNSTKDIESLDTKRDDTQNSNVLIEKTKPSSGFLYVENIEKPINVEVTTDITFNFKDPIESNSSCKIIIAEEDSCINKNEIVNNVSEQSIDLIEYSPLSPVFHKCGSLKKLPIMSTQTLNCVNSNNSNQPEIISVNVQMPVMASNDDDSNTFRDLVESDNYDSNDGKSDDNLKKDNSFSKEDILGHSTLKKKELLGKEDDCLEPPPKRKCGIPKRADVSSASKVEQEINQFEKECVIGQKSLKRNNDVTLDVSNNYTIMAKPGKSNVFPYETCTLISDKSSNIPDCNNDIKSNESISSMKNENPYVGLLQKIINLPYKKRGNKRKASTSCDNSFSDSENNIIMNANKSNYKNSNTNIEILDKFTHLLPEKQTSQKNEFIIEKNKQEAFAENVCNNSDSRFGVITVPERPCLTDVHLNEEPCLSFSQTIMPNHIATKTDNINSLSDTEIISCNSSCNNIEDKISKEHLTQIGCNSENNDSCYEGDISCPAVLNSVDLIETQVNCLEPQLKRRPGRPPKRRSIDSTQIEKASNKRQHILNVDNGESVNSNFLTGSVSIKVSESFFKLTEDIDQNKSASKIYLDKKTEGIPHSIDMKYKNKEILRVNDILSETLLEAKEMMKTENNPLDVTVDSGNKDQLRNSNEVSVKIEGNDISHKIPVKAIEIIKNSGGSSQLIPKRKPGRPKKYRMNTNEDCKCETEIIDGMSTNKVLNPNGFNNEEGELNKRNDDSDLVPFKVEETDNDRMNSSEPLQNRKPLPKISLPVNTEDEIIVKQGIAYNGNEFDGMSNSNNIGSNSNLNQESSGICSQDSVKTENIVKSQIDCSEPTPKRKPGRPKKNRVPLSCNDEVAFSSETGDQNRKKNEILNSNNNLRSSLSLSEGNGGFSLDSIEAEKVAFTPTACSEHVFKRKRGRPRKVPKIATSTPVNCHSQTSHESGIGSHSIKNCMEGARASPAHFSRRSVRVKRDTSFLDSEFIQISYDNSKYIDDNSFFDVSLLDESPQCLPKKQRGRKKGFKVKQDIDAENEDINCLYTNYIIYSNEGIKLETFEQNLENHNATEFNISPVEANSSQEMTGQNQLELTSKQLARQMTEGQNQLELTSKQLARLTKKKSLSGRVDTSTRLRRPNDMVKCAVCGEIMKVKDYQKIHLVKHNFISWLEGEEPLPVDDFDSMDVVLTRGKRAYPRLFFKCEICGHEKKSSKGFLSHRQICGKTDKERQNMLQPCVYCGRLLMPSSLPPHLYQNHRSQTEAIQQEPLGPMRKAAARCLGKIASYIEDEVSAVNADDFHQDVDGDEEFDEIEEISLLYVPIQKKKLTKHLLERWKLLVSENKEISCYLPTCDFKTFSYDNILEHHKSCISGDCQGYSCIKCNYVCKIEDEMREHVKSCNPPIIVSQSEDSESEEHEKNVVIPYLKTAEQNLVYQRIKCHFFKPALKWMKQIYEAYFSKEILFHEFEFNLDLWKELDAQTCKFYNPELSESMKISYQNSSWENMHTLEGKVLEGDQGLGFTGGPIWALEWCPGEGDQYLAVSSHLKMETNFEAGSTFTGPGLIQLWSLEDIENSRNVPLSTLQFSYGICHNERSCWSMAWCPSGARTEKRIGLLALATTSGSIPVYAMPNPQCLLSQSTRFYKPEPVLKLELWSNERWQCYSISWSKVKPHTIIAAGFVNGIVAIWDLSSQSKLLRNKNILHPFKVFQAHHSIITGICLSPESDSYLATASYDKSFKYWDLKDTTAPQSVLKRGLFTSVGWLRHWMSAVTTYDNAYTMLQTSVSLNSIRSFVAPTMQIVTSVNSTSWSVSVSDWLNGAVASYDNGQVVLFFALKQTYYQHLEKRKYTKVLLQSSLHSFESNSSEPLSKENNIPSNSYGDAVQKYGLAIRTDLAIGKYDKLSEKGTESMNDIYPLSSINRVSWNSNKQSFLYVAMGYQSGFLVVSKLSMPKTDQALIDEVSKSE